MPLTSSQIRELKKQAHGLKPVVMVGQQGLSENVLAEIDATLDIHELIKVKLAGADKAERVAMSETIVGGLSASLVQIIGRVAVFLAGDFRMGMHVPTELHHLGEPIVDCPIAGSATPGASGRTRSSTPPTTWRHIQMWPLADSILWPTI